MMQRVKTPLLWVLLLLAACSGSAKTATGGSATGTSSSSSADYTAYCAVMKRTDDPIRAGANASVSNPAALLLASQAEQERFLKSPPELDLYWRQYLGGHSTEAANYLRDWTYQHCGFEPMIGG